MFSLLFRSIAQLRYQSQAEAVLVQIRKLNSSYPSSTDFQTLIEALIQAEDHRFYSHYGVDIRSIVRAIMITVFTSCTQGASTITQQLARVITGDYRRSIARKFKELCLAAWLDSKVAKHEQAIAYLCVAYFGWRMNGWRQAVNRLRIDFPCSASDAAAVIARLKYPEPHHPSPRQLRRIRNRQNHILGLLNTKSEIPS